jgi:hypothetical protein
MMRICTSFPWKIENGTLALSSDLERDEQDIISVIFTRIPERIMRPYTAGTNDLLFDSQNAPNLIAKKLDVAVEEQCPTIAQCSGSGRVADDGTVIVQLNWTPKAQPQIRSLTIGVSG